MGKEEKMDMQRKKKRFYKPRIKISRRGVSLMYLYYVEAGFCYYVLLGEDGGVLVIASNVVLARVLCHTRLSHENAIQPKLPSFVQNFV
jgi:hypothetical protein